MKLADKLLYLRKKQGLSQLKLAEMMNVSRQAISRWETGVAVPSAESLKYLGNLYNVSLDYLFNDGADEFERNKKNEIKEEAVSASDEEKLHSKNGKIKRVILIFFFLLVIVICIFMRVEFGAKTGSELSHIKELPSEEVDIIFEDGFDIN